jgi:hypothetical protein
MRRKTQLTFPEPAHSHEALSSVVREWLVPEMVRQLLAEQGVEAASPERSRWSVRSFRNGFATTADKGEVGKKIRL